MIYDKYRGKNTRPQCVNIFLPSMPGLAKWFLPLRFSIGNFVCMSYTAFMLLVPPVIFRNSIRFKSTNDKTPYYVIFSVLLTYLPSLCSICVNALSVKDQVLHSYKTAGKFTDHEMEYNIIYMFLYSCQAYVTVSWQK
jgi:hypothetical protein